MKSIEDCKRREAAHKKYPRSFAIERDDRFARFLRLEKIHCEECNIADEEKSDRLLAGLRMLEVVIALNAQLARDIN